jgi:hypothetical protein
MKLINLFESRPTGDKEVIEMIKPNWSQYQKYYEDAKEHISKWENQEVKTIIIEKLIMKIKPAKPSKKERNYWQLLEELRNPR